MNQKDEKLLKLIRKALHRSRDRSLSTLVDSIRMELWEYQIRIDTKLVRGMISLGDKFSIGCRSSKPDKE